MTNITKTTYQQQSLLAEAFAALLEKLGPEKTAQVWQVFTAPYGDYLKIPPTLFAGMDGATMDQEIRKFNRE
jgi:hypothetical protein